MSSKVKAVSLFSGLGGMDIGLNNADIETVLCVDKDPKAAETLRENSSKHSEDGSYHWNVEEKDVREVNYSEKLEEIGHSPEEIDLVAGGSPCQPFSKSNSGNRKGANSEQGSLYKHFADVLEKLNPEAFVFENVRGIKSTNNGKDFDKILEQFRTAGYNVSHKLMNTANFGVPQKRKRLIIVGIKDSEFSFPSPTHTKESKEGKDWLTTGEALEDLSAEDPEQLKVGGKYGHLLEDIPPGANYQHFSERKYSTEEEKYIERKEEELDEKVFDWRSRHWNYLLKLDPERPSWTIQAQPGKYTGPFHWEGRRLSIQETKRIMDIPLEYEISGDKRSTKQWQLGNAVPPGLAESIGKKLKEELFEEEATVPLQRSS